MVLSRGISEGFTEEVTLELTLQGKVEFHQVDKWVCGDFLSRRQAQDE